MANITDINRLATQNGFVTYEEFCRNPQKWRKARDEMFQMAEKGASQVWHLIAKKGMIHRFKKYEARSLDKIAHIIESEGYTLDEVKFEPSLIPESAGKYVILMNWVPTPQAEEKRRNAIQAG